VDRVMAGESPAALARELGIAKKFLYEWRDAGRGSQGAPKVKKQEADSPEVAKAKRLQARILQLEQLLGRQTAELSFFEAALRSVKGTCRKSGANTGEGSTQ